VKSSLTPDQKIALIREACRRGGGTHDWDDYQEGIIDGKYQIFDSDHGVCITEILQAPRKRYLQCWVVAGQLPEVMALQKQVDRHALTNDCEVEMTIGRVGWDRVLPHYGWKKTGSVFVRHRAMQNNLGPRWLQVCHKPSGNSGGVQSAQTQNQTQLPQWIQNAAQDIYRGRTSRRTSRPLIRASV
jgi:hypothetical protein